MDPFFAADIDPSMPAIDLHHTHTIVDALDELERELFYFSNSDMPYVRVIHGIGEGKLAKAVHKALDKNPMVVQWKQEGGSTIVLL